MDHPSPPPLSFDFPSRPFIGHPLAFQSLLCKLAVKRQGPHLRQYFLRGISRILLKLDAHIATGNKKKLILNKKGPS